MTTEESNLRAGQFDHFFAGYQQFGMKPERVRGLCMCGYVTRPLMTTAEARAEFAREHAPVVKQPDVEDGQVFQ